jgi:hypothetical protein
LMPGTPAHPNHGAHAGAGTGAKDASVVSVGVVQTAYANGASSK